jgi:hypothetical protein
MYLVFMASLSFFCYLDFREGGIAMGGGQGGGGEVGIGAGRMGKHCDVCGKEV